MKKIFFFFPLGLLCFCITTGAIAQEMIATQADITRLKNDLRQNIIQIGKTRLLSIRENYGDAPTITGDTRKIVYDYGDLRIEFSKDRYLKDWEYDTFKDPAYTDDIDKLRKDLESEEIVGDFITLKQIVKDYDEPTDFIESDRDGELSIYYYGDIKLTFENNFTVQKWRGKNLDQAADQNMIGSKAQTASASSSDKK